MYSVIERKISEIKFLDECWNDKKELQFALFITD